MWPRTSPFVYATPAEPEAGGGAEARAGDEDAAVLGGPDPLAALLVGGGEQLLE